MTLRAPSTARAPTYWPGKVVSVQGTTPGPASGITYTVRLDTARGPSEYAGAVPNNWRWPDTLDTDAGLMVGKRINAWIIGDRVFLDVIEPPRFGECPP